MNTLVFLLFLLPLSVSSKENPPINPDQLKVLKEFAQKLNCPKLVESPDPCSVWDGFVDCELSTFGEGSTVVSIKLPNGCASGNFPSNVLTKLPDLTWFRMGKNPNVTGDFVVGVHVPADSISISLDLGIDSFKVSGKNSLRELFSTDSQGRSNLKKIILEDTHSLSYLDVSRTSLTSLKLMKASRIQFSLYAIRSRLTSFQTGEDIQYSVLDLRYNKPSSFTWISTENMPLIDLSNNRITKVIVQGGVNFTTNPFCNFDQNPFPCPILKELEVYCYAQCS